MKKALLAASVLLLGSTPAFAQEPLDGNHEANPRVVFGMWPSEGACTSDNTKAVALRDLLRDLPRHRDECISTTGFLMDRALFLRREDTELKYPSSNDAAEDRRLGLYANEQSMEKIWNNNGARVRIVGKLWDCEMLNGPDVIMVMGYCHYTGGPIIGVVSLLRLR